jgi:outer membrane autotransporter protein
LNLVVPGSTFDSVRSTLGARASYAFNMADGTRMALEGRVGWAHEFGDQPVLSARLSGDPTGASFAVSGISLPRDSAVLGVGFAAEAKRNLRLYADLSAELSRVQRSHALSGGLRYQW